MIYWDHAGTTPPDDDVVSTMAEVMKKHYGNPSALHQYGEEAAKLLKKAREVCAAALEAEPSEIVLTSGATEGNNMAIKGAALQYKSRGKHLITTRTEHPSVYESFRQLEQLGWEVTYVPVDANGRVDVQALADAVRKDTVLVSIMHVNNETGAVQPLMEIGQTVKQRNHRTLFHIDGVQGFGKLEVSLKNWQADLYTLSAHKFNGPRGIGVLYVRRGVELFPLLSGGQQENGHRAGTENVAAAVGMAKAMRLGRERQPEFYRQASLIRNKLLQEIAEIPGTVMNSSREGAPHIMNFSYPGVKPEVIVHALEELGMLVSTKSACSSKLSEPSRVLLEMGKDMSIASSGIRISLGRHHRLEDAERLIDALKTATGKLRPFIERKGTTN
ncbi:cysteine desulfurase family protein [Paenibacillus sp. FSL M8-0334]|uniref:Aminotransferase class V-fold PLP-dependent enzyme n=1 Tax=Paenibacillus campinasensis TaxID=66347 RepID=A0ABW9SY26_9BACL|nr:cysteine desulfurase family protein [Paenibacillus campinasensis]MUG64624.1 aminotransferase class V-fold PLP-dependent enzyme [Paenibacillus campinasensis]